MILPASSLIERLTDKRNSARNKNLDKDRNLTKSGDKKRTVEDLDRNDKPAGPDLFIRDAGSGRRVGDTQIPPELEIPAAMLARLGGNQQEIANTFGMGQRKVSGLKNGDGISEESDAVVKEALGPIRETLVDKISQSLAHIDDEKLGRSNAQSLANIARSLTSALEATRDKTQDISKESNIKIVIHGVERVEVAKYEVIDVPH